MSHEPVVDSLYGEFADEYDDRHGTVGVRGMPDIPFYSRLALEAGGAVVELGVGTGRVAIPSVLAGARVLGIDLSSRMLAIARRKAVAQRVERELGLVLGDMRRFALTRPAALVTIPFRAFLHNLTTDDQLATLASCRAALRPGGRLALNIFNPDLAMIADWMKLSPEDRVRPDALVADAWESCDYDPSRQRIDSVVRMRGPDGERRIAFRTRWVYRFEMQHLLERSGFEVETLHGDFEGTAFDVSSPEMVWVARAV
ncbi:MAG TPA: class I SAM-dependent methyltransferase [Dehalococcoidia bacterium]|nr:class I SAM-dependent methyltransferase [Dehalococcoidia bacterium]